MYVEIWRCNTHFTLCGISPLFRNALVKMAVCYIHTSTSRSTFSITLTFFFSTLCFL